MVDYIIPILIALLVSVIWIRYAYPELKENNKNIKRIKELLEELGERRKNR